jgi:hypothetical protein
MPWQQAKAPGRALRRAWVEAICYRLLEIGYLLLRANLDSIVNRDQ